MSKAKTKPLEQLNQNAMSLLSPEELEQAKLYLDTLIRNKTQQEPSTPRRQNQQQSPVLFPLQQPVYKPKTVVQQSVVQQPQPVVRQHVNRAIPWSKMSKPAITKFIADNNLKQRLPAYSKLTKEELVKLMEDFDDGMYDDYRKPSNLPQIKQLQVMTAPKK